MDMQFQKWACWVTLWMQPIFILHCIFAMPVFCCIFYICDHPSAIVKLLFFASHVCRIDACNMSCKNLHHNWSLLVANKKNSDVMLVLQEYSISKTWQNWQWYSPAHNASRHSNITFAFSYLEFLNGLINTTPTFPKFSFKDSFFKGFYCTFVQFVEKSISCAFPFSFPDWWYSDKIAGS